MTLADALARIADLEREVARLTLDSEEAERLERIAARYHGQMDTFELTPESRTQLAFDLGWLIGLGYRLRRRIDGETATRA